MAFLYPQSLQLQNDSPYKLDAVIISANGKVLGRAIVEVGDHITWTYDNFGEIEYANKPSVPFTVIWYCHKGGTEYGIWPVATPGSRINAQGSSGPRICKMKDEKDFLKEHKEYNQSIENYSGEDYSPNDELNTSDES